MHAGVTMDDAQIASIGQRADDLDIAVRSCFASALHLDRIMQH